MSISPIFNTPTSSPIGQQPTGSSIANQYKNVPLLNGTPPGGNGQTPLTQPIQTPSGPNTSSNNGVGGSQNVYYMVPPSVVDTWNTKRILPPVLLSQYTPFAILFLLDDANGSLGSSLDSSVGENIILGGPTDTIMDLQTNVYDNETATKRFGDMGSNSGPSENPKYILRNTLYLTDTISNGFQMGAIGAIPAKIKGYNNDAIVNLIPLTLKLPQLTTPEMKGIIDMTDCSVRIGTTPTSLYSGNAVVDLKVVINDINEMFSVNGVMSRLFEQFNRYFLVFGWQGPNVDGVDFVGKSSTKITDSTINAELLDGATHNFNFPTPIVTSDGLLNYPSTKGYYEIDINDTDNGNRMNIAIQAQMPNMSFRDRKVFIDITGTSAGTGLNFIGRLSAFSQGNPMRNAILKAINEGIKPIAHFNFVSIKPDNSPMFDSNSGIGKEINRNYWENLAAGGIDGAGKLLLKIMMSGNTSSTSLSSNPNYTKIPAAYRLGDVITAITEVADTYFFDRFGSGDAPEQAVRSALESAGVVSIKLGSVTKPVRDLDAVDIFNIKNQSGLQSDFEQALQGNDNLLDADNIAIDDPVFRDLKAIDFKSFVHNGLTPVIAKSIAYQVIASSPKEAEWVNFIGSLRNFEESINGEAVNVVKYTKNTKWTPAQEQNSKNVFSWESSYEESFGQDGKLLQNINEQIDANVTGLESISVGDIPVSVHTLSQMLQHMKMDSSMEILLQDILSDVSEQFGFTLILQHYPPGYSQQTNSLKTQYEYIPSQRRATSTPTPAVAISARGNIQYVIEDMNRRKSSANNTISSLANNAQKNISNSIANVSGQLSAITPNMKSGDANVNANDVASQTDFLKNEYSALKMKEFFLLENYSSNSLLKSIDYHRIGDVGIYTDTAFKTIQELGKLMNSSNGQMLPRTLSSHRRKIVENYTSLARNISRELTKSQDSPYRAMPGTTDYEIRFVQSLSEKFDFINPNSSNYNKQQTNNPNDKSTYVSTELFNTITKLNASSGVIIDKNVREEFLAQIVTTYLINRPMGVDEVIYFGKITAEIHGTTGLGPLQHFYMRGLTNSLNGVYAIDSLTHTISSAGFLTSFEATVSLVDSKIYDLVDDKSKLLGKL